MHDPPYGAMGVPHDALCAGTFDSYYIITEYTPVQDWVQESPQPIPFSL